MQNQECSEHHFQMTEYIVACISLLQLGTGKSNRSLLFKYYCCQLGVLSIYFANPKIICLVKVLMFLFVLKKPVPYCLIPNHLSSLYMYGSLYNNDYSSTAISCYQE